MFARRLHVFMKHGSLATAAMAALALGTGCNDGPDAFFEHPVKFAAAASGANVIPKPAPADTSASASATYNAYTQAYTYTIQVAPSGTIDSIARYQVSNRDPLPPSATAILCAGAAACAATSGTATVVPPATPATIASSMRGYGTQWVFFTTTAQKAVGGAMRRTVYLNP